MKNPNEHAYILQIVRTHKLLPYAPGPYNNHKIRFKGTSVNFYGRAVMQCYGGRSGHSSATRKRVRV